MEGDRRVEGDDVVEDGLAEVSDEIPAHRQQDEAEVERHAGCRGSADDDSPLRHPSDAAVLGAECVNCAGEIKRFD